MRAPSIVLAAVIAATVAPAAPAAAAAQDPAARLDSVARAAERAGFAGVVRVQRDGVVLLERGYGLANRAARIPFTPATVVQIGSNTKDFTAVAVLALHLAGRLSLDDPLARYVAEVPADKRAITLRHLLHHRAGFPLGIGPDGEAVAREAYVARAMATPLRFAPGARESYSNVGYALLAAVIERVAGTSYDAHVRDAILRPLGMTRTGFHLPGFRDEELARGYLASGADHGTMLSRPHAPDGPWWNLRGNGGMLSTVGEMQRFYTALLDGETLLPRGAARAGLFAHDEPMALNGSDGVSFFAYERAPRARVEIIVASNNPAVRAPAVVRDLARVLGLAVGGPPAGERVAARPGGRPAPAAVAGLLRGFVDALNSADTARVRRYLAEHFVAGPGAPTLGERMEGAGRMHERLGAITVERVEAFDDGSVEMRVRTALDGAGTFRFEIEPGPPPKVRRLGVMMGG